MPDAAAERWYDWLENLRERIGSYKLIAEKLSLHENTVLNWRKGGLPDPAQEVSLAELAGEDLGKLQGLLDATRQEMLAKGDPARTWSGSPGEPGFAPAGSTGDRLRKPPQPMVVS